MPRKYNWKKEQAYSIESLERALQETKEKKITFQQANEKYGIPRSTLYDQVKKSVYLSYHPKKR